VSALLVGEVPPGVVTVMSTGPVSAGAVAVSEVGELYVAVAASRPKSTIDPATNPVPVMVTVVPPPLGPVLGLTDVTVGTGSNVNRSAALVAEVPPVVVTVTSAVPAVSAGAVAVIEVAELTVTSVAACPVPNETVDPATKLVPVIATDVPPAVGPDDGLTAVTVGAAEAAWALQPISRNRQAASVSARRASCRAALEHGGAAACSPGRSRSLTRVHVPTHR
jgi:hypothetical protein